MKPSPIHRCLGLIAVVSLLVPSAGAVLVFQSGFTTTPSPNFAFNSSGGSAGINENGPGGSRSIELIDSSESSSTTAILTPTVANGFPAFDTSLAGQEILQFSARFAVTSMSVAASNVNVPRIILQNLTTSADSIHVGLGRTSSGNTILYAGRGGNSNPSNTDTRTLLYNYVGYNTGDASENDTNDLYVTINITYVIGSGIMTVSAYDGATLLGSGEVSGFGTSTTFDNSNLAVTVTTGTSAASTVYLDDVLLQTIPEPAAAFLGALGLLSLVRRRR